MKLLLSAIALVTASCCANRGVVVAAAAGDGGSRAAAAGPGGYTPGWTPTYDMQLSTVIQPCSKDKLMSNGKNWPTIRSFGLIDIGE